MSNLLFRHALALTLTSLVFFLAGCGPGVTYTPPFGFVSLRVSTDGISVQASSPGLETPVGTFSVDLSTMISAASSQRSTNDGLLVTIRYYNQGTLVDDAHQINTRGSKVTVTADGHLTFSVEQQRVFIDGSQGTIQTVEVKNPDYASSLASDTPTATPLPTLTPKQQARSVIDRYYTAINSKDYQTAYNQWANYSDSYQNFANGFADTTHDVYQFDQITERSDGTVQVYITLTATSTSFQQTIYQGYYIVGQLSDGSWKIITASMHRA